jgi:hypothetical protein
MLKVSASACMHRPCLHRPNLDATGDHQNHSRHSMGMGKHAHCRSLPLHSVPARCAAAQSSCSASAATQRAAAAARTAAEAHACSGSTCWLARARGRPP